MTSTVLLCLVGFFIYGPQSLDRHRRRQPGHEARRRGSRRPHQRVRLFEHDALRRGDRALVQRYSADANTAAFENAALATSSIAGLGGIISAAFTSRGMEVLTARQGWDAGFAMFVVCSMVGVLIFAVCWKAKRTDTRKAQRDRNWVAGVERSEPPATSWGRHSCLPKLAGKNACPTCSDPP